MTGKRIICLSCGQEGEIEGPSLKALPSSPCLFRYLGHNPFSGHMHYQCPACKVVLLVDPMIILEEGMIAPLSPRLLRKRSGIRPVGRLFQLGFLLRKLLRQQRAGYC